ncbi:hypothetical protein THAOC_33509, partial [Thalassiosira oceanica]
MSDESRTSKPNPKAGPEGDNNKHQQTDEEKMLDDIAKQKNLIDQMPGDTVDDMTRRAPHQKKLGQLEFKYNIFAEKKRLACVLSKFEEIHGALYSEPCLICLEDINVLASESTQLLACCGGLVCATCVPNLTSDKCPLCRESLAATSEADDAAKLMTLAKRGVTWAQTEVGRSMIGVRDGRDGFKKQEKAGLEWIKKAATHIYPMALSYLSKLYSPSDLLDESQEKANELLLESANLGHARSNSELAKYYSNGTDGFEQDPIEAHFRASAAFALDGKEALDQAALLPALGQPVRDALVRPVHPVLAPLPRLADRHGGRLHQPLRGRLPREPPPLLLAQRRGVVRERPLHPLRALLERVVGQAVREALEEGVGRVAGQYDELVHREGLGRRRAQHLGRAGVEEYLVAGAAERGVVDHAGEAGGDGMPPPLEAGRRGVEHELGLLRIFGIAVP